MWIALLTVMTVIKRGDRKAYWREGSRHFMMSVNFSEYMSYKRFTDIMKMHVFEVPSKQQQVDDLLYQIRTTIAVFNEHMVKCIIPAKYLVIDESMNQWLGTGMPNLKKVPRKPHPIGQEFKTLADHHTYCIIQIDTVSDPKPKEYSQACGFCRFVKNNCRLAKMVKSVVARKATEVARKRELLNFEATNVVLDEGIRSLREEQPRKIIKKKPIVKNLKYVFNCLARKKAKTYKELYYKTLSRNHILDLSDANKDSQLTRMSKQEREAILKKNFPIPSTQAKDFTPIEKHIKENISVIKNISL
ncbi:unnamed protein product [Mucor hiemalis]